MNRTELIVLVTKLNQGWPHDPIRLDVSGGRLNQGVEAMLEEWLHLGFAGIELVDAENGLALLFDSQERRPAAAAIIQAARASRRGREAPILELPVHRQPVPLPVKERVAEVLHVHPQRWTMPPRDRNWKAPAVDWRPHEHRVGTQFPTVTARFTTVVLQDGVAHVHLLHYANDLEPRFYVLPVDYHAHPFDGMTVGPMLVAAIVQPVTTEQR